MINEKDIMGESDEKQMTIVVIVGYEYCRSTKYSMNPVQHQGRYLWGDSKVLLVTPKVIL